jgi:hypothetical protein
MALAKWQRRLIDDSVYRLKQLIDPESKAVAIDPFNKERDAEIREAVRIYISSWVIPELEAVRDGKQPSHYYPPARKEGP